jgi:hypothetical protein
MNPGGQKDEMVGGDFNLRLGPHCGVGWFISAGPIGEHVETAGHQSRAELGDTTCGVRKNLRHVWQVLAERSPRPLLHTLDLPILNFLTLSGVESEGSSIRY